MDKDLYNLIKSNPEAREYFLMDDHSKSKKGKYYVIKTKQGWGLKKLGIVGQFFRKYFGFYKNTHEKSVKEDVRKSFLKLKLIHPNDASIQAIEKIDQAFNRSLYAEHYFKVPQIEGLKINGTKLNNVKKEISETDVSSVDLQKVEASTKSIEKKVDMESIEELLTLPNLQKVYLPEDPKLGANVLEFLSSINRLELVDNLSILQFYPEKSYLPYLEKLGYVELPDTPLENAVEYTKFKGKKYYRKEDIQKLNLRQEDVKNFEQIKDLFSLSNVKEVEYPRHNMELNMQAYKFIEEKGLSENMQPTLDDFSFTTDKSLIPSMKELLLSKDSNKQKFDVACKMLFYPRGCRIDDGPPKAFKMELKSTLLEDEELADMFIKALYRHHPDLDRIVLRQVWKPLNIHVESCRSIFKAIGNQEKEIWLDGEDLINYIENEKNGFEPFIAALKKTPGGKIAETFSRIDNGTGIREIELRYNYPGNFKQGMENLFNQVDSSTQLDMMHEVVPYDEWTNCIPLMHDPVAVKNLLEEVLSFYLSEKGDFRGFYTKFQSIPNFEEILSEFKEKIVKGLGSEKLASDLIDLFNSGHYNYNGLDHESLDQMLNLDIKNFHLISGKRAKEYITKKFDHDCKNHPEKFLEESLKMLMRMSSEFEVLKRTSNLDKPQHWENETAFAASCLQEMMMNHQDEVVKAIESKNFFENKFFENLIRVLTEKNARQITVSLMFTPRVIKALYTHHPNYFVNLSINHKNVFLFPVINEFINREDLSELGSLIVEMVIQSKDPSLAPLFTALYVAEKGKANARSNLFNITSDLKDLNFTEHQELLNKIKNSITFEQVQNIYKNIAIPKADLQVDSFLSDIILKQKSQPSEIPQEFLSNPYVMGHVLNHPNAKDWVKGYAEGLIKDEKAAELLALLNHSAVSRNPSLLEGIMSVRQKMSEQIYNKIIDKNPQLGTRVIIETLRLLNGDVDAETYAEDFPKMDVPAYNDSSAKILSALMHVDFDVHEKLLEMEKLPEVSNHGFGKASKNSNFFRSAVIPNVSPKNSQDVIKKIKDENDSAQLEKYISMYGFTKELLEIPVENTQLSFFKEGKFDQLIKSANNDFDIIYQAYKLSDDKQKMRLLQQLSIHLKNMEANATNYEMITKKLPLEFSRGIPKKFNDFMALDAVHDNAVKLYKGEMTFKEFYGATYGGKEFERNRILTNILGNMPEKAFDEFLDYMKNENNLEIQVDLMLLWCEANAANSVKRSIETSSFLKGDDSIPSEIKNLIKEFATGSNEYERVFDVFWEGLYSKYQTKQWSKEDFELKDFGITLLPDHALEVLEKELVSKKTFDAETKEFFLKQIKKVRKDRLL